jgi:hypothetical protein
VINPRTAPCDEGIIRSIPAAANCVASEKPWILLATILASSIAYMDELSSILRCRPSKGISRLRLW